MKFIQSLFKDFGRFSGHLKWQAFTDLLFPILAVIIFAIVFIVISLKRFFNNMVDKILMQYHHLSNRFDSMKVAPNTP